LEEQRKKEKKNAKKVDLWKVKRYGKERKGGNGLTSGTTKLTAIFSRRRRRSET